MIDSNEATAETKQPSQNVHGGNDMIIISPGSSWTLTRMLKGLTINQGQLLGGLSAKNNGVGSLWADLVDRGWNAYLLPLPGDGSAYGNGTSGSLTQMPDGNPVPDAVDNDGTGQIINEVNYESHIVGTLARLKVGLVGWSFGGGLVNLISQAVLSNLPLVGGPQVIYGGTIDGITYPGSGSPLHASPAYYWADSYGYNYYELNRQLFGIRYSIEGSANVAGAVNELFGSDDHGTIGLDQAVYDRLEADLGYTYNQFRDNEMTGSAHGNESNVFSSVSSRRVDDSRFLLKRDFQDGAFVWTIQDETGITFYPGMRSLPRRLGLCSTGFLLTFAAHLAVTKSISYYLGPPYSSPSPLREWCVLINTILVLPCCFLPGFLTIYEADAWAYSPGYMVLNAAIWGAVIFIWIFWKLWNRNRHITHYLAKKRGAKKRGHYSSVENYRSS